MNGKEEFLANVNAHPKILTGAEVQMCLEGADVFWLYQNGKLQPDPSFPHVVLHSGLHSNGFVMAGEALKSNSGFRESVARSLLHLLPTDWDEIFTYIVGAATSSTALAGDMARLSRAKHIRMTKLDGGAGQMWHPENDLLDKDHLILCVEELITTAASDLEVRKGIRQKWVSAQIHFARYLLTMIDRSDPDNRVTLVENSQVISLLRLNTRNFELEKCPYCKVGSEAIKPKTEDGRNWARLMEQMR